MRPIDVFKLAPAIAAAPGGGGGGPPPGGGGGGGGGSAVVSITDQTISKNSIHGATVTATYSLGSDGGVYNQAGTLLETWLTGGVSSNYQVQATKTGGAVLAAGSAALGTWLACSTTRSWSLSAVDGEDKETILSISVRDATAPNTVRDTATITLDAASTLVDTGGPPL